MHTNGIATICQSAWAGAKMTPATSAGRAKIMPPIVGMPCLTLCDCGPSSLMVCPNFIRLSQGIKIGPSASAITKAANIV